MKENTPLRDITATARQKLKGNWGLAVALMVTLQLILSGTTLGFCGWLFAGPLAVGLSSFFLSIHKGNPQFSQLFDGFNCFGRAFISNILMSFYISLWSLLFLIPGIIKTYSYAMTFFIIADNPSIRVLDAITSSRQIMRGNKMRLFGLSLRYLGWGFVCLFTFGIGFLWLWPYMMAGTTAFYMDIKDKG